MSNEVAEIIESFWVAFFGTASYVSIAALALYDHCITIDREVQHIWKKRLNILSVFFIVNRYALLIATLGMASTELFPRARSMYEIQTSFNLSPSSSDIFLILAVWDAASALSIIFSFLVLCGTLVKTLKLKRIANQAGLRQGLTTLLIRDAIFNVSNRVPGMELAFPEEFGLHRLRPVIVSHMILDLKEIDQVVMGSQAETGHSGRFSSIHFVGNVGAPLNTSLMGDNDEVSRPCIITPVSTKQFIEDPLSIGLFGEEVIDPDSDRRPGPISGAENIVVEV
ncbi:hypothetical protein C8Q75DRAFT_810583 [Abortiporus biennis]|nr:hypothetical protein C8Q75DRAFT_810583 [Abortiporus biennis]